MDTHKELMSFYNLLEQTDYQDIVTEYGNHTRKIVKVKLPNASLHVSYTNVRTTYEIYFKGVLIKITEIDSDTKIDFDVKKILDTMRSNIVKQFLEYGKSEA